MKALSRIFFKGLMITLPVVLSFGLLYWSFAASEQMLRIPIEMLLPEGWYFPGMGVAAAIVIVFFLGLLVQAYVINTIFGWFEALVERIPVVKTLYTFVRDLLKFLAGDSHHSMQQVVQITIDGDIQMIGFVTGDNVSLGDQSGLVSVYLPLSYQIGGFLLYLPKSRCTPLDIPVQQAMQQVWTAHVAHRHEPPAEK